MPQVVNSFHVVSEDGFVVLGLIMLQLPIVSVCLHNESTSEALETKEN